MGPPYERGSAHLIMRLAPLPFGGCLSTTSPGTIMLRIAAQQQGIL
jgi:hypothetical protein